MLVTIIWTTTNTTTYDTFISLSKSDFNWVREYTYYTYLKSLVVFIRLLCTIFKDNLL